MAVFWFSFRLEGNDADARRAALYARVDVISRPALAGLGATMLAPPPTRAWFDPTSFGLFECNSDVHYVAGILTATLDSLVDVLIVRDIAQGPTLVFGVPENLGTLSDLLGNEFELVE